MKRADVVEMFTRLRELNPKPTTELAYTTVFELLVAVVLSAQATDVGVNKATRLRLQRICPHAGNAAALIRFECAALPRRVSGVWRFC